MGLNLDCISSFKKKKKRTVLLVSGWESIQNLKFVIVSLYCFFNKQLGQKIQSINSN